MFEIRPIKLILLLLLISPWTARAQERQPITPFGKMYLPVWQEAKRHCLEVANAMPDSLYGYKPTTISKSFAEQMVHIAHTIPLLCKRYVEGLEVKGNAPDASAMSKHEIIKMLNESFDYVTGVIYEIPQAKLDETCVMYHSCKPCFGFDLCARPHGQPPLQSQSLYPDEQYRSSGIYLVKGGPIYFNSYNFLFSPMLCILKIYESAHPHSSWHY